jgi:S-layer homology domain
MKIRESMGRIIPALFAAAVLATPCAIGEEARMTAGEQLKRFHESWVAAGRPSPEATLIAKEFGIQDGEVVNVHAYEFQANTSTDLILDDGNGYRYFGAPAVPYMAAPVRLPSGIFIDGLSISYCNENSGDLVFGLFDNGEGGSGSGGGSLVGVPAVSNGGCSFSGQGLSFYEYDGSGGHPLYLVAYFADGAFDGTARFNFASINYRRRVSGDAASQASFADVPMTDFGFQYIEALAASGITGGCGGGNFCPESSVNRRQMAIFLAKALGLHWSASPPPN